MQKPLALSIALCLGLTSCQLVQKSRTWETVMSVRPGECIREADPSSSYAEKLHRVLLEQGVEHVVVTYQYHYHTAHYEEALGTRTAVVYRDNTDSRYPWWLKDDRLQTPFWLPNGDLDKQISYYARRPVQVIEKKAYPGGAASGKAALAHFRPVKVQSREQVAQRPPPAPRPQVAERSQPAPKIVQAKPPLFPWMKPSPAVQQPAPEKPAPSAPAPAPVAVTQIQRPPAVAISKPKPASAPAFIPPPVAAPVIVTRSEPVIVTHSEPAWTPPTSLAPVEQGPEPTSRNERLEKLFRARNGSSYDPFSPADRRKMEQLKRERQDGNLSGENGIRQGVDGSETRSF